MNQKFFIYKSSVSIDEKPDVSFIPMMTRRKLSRLAKIAYSTLYGCHPDLSEGVNLVFASHYGEFDILENLIEQYSSENEVSPILFSSSVHNATIGNYSLLNNIKNKYNAVSAGENSISNGLLEAFTESEKTLFCYADTLPYSKSLSCFVGHEEAENSDEIQIIMTENLPNGQEFERFARFLNKETDEFEAPIYTLRRMK